MRSRLLPLLIVLMAAVLLTLGFPLAISVAAAEQQRLVIDRIDDTARFAALAQSITDTSPDSEERRRTLQTDLELYASVYDIRAYVFFRDDRALAKAPGFWNLPAEGRGARPSTRRCWAAARTTPRRSGPGATAASSSPPPSCATAMWSPWSSSTRPPARCGPGSCGRGCSSASARRWRCWWRSARRYGSPAGSCCPYGPWTRPPTTSPAGRMRSRVAASAGPPELRRLARSFNEMADNVEDVLEQQRAFVADASHQLRNPLAALLLRIELLALELPEDSEEIAAVRTEGKRLARVLDDLLDLALAEHAEADLQLIDIVPLAAERVASWRPMAEREGVNLTLDGAPAATAWADPVALSSALDAVIDNALKFTPAGEDVTVTVAAGALVTTVVVADRGPGLTEAELERVGDRFWRSTRHQNVSGSGLGLSISRVLLAAGGGSIAYEHHAPHGLRVTVSVPRDLPGS